MPTVNGKSSILSLKSSIQILHITIVARLHVGLQGVRLSIIDSVLHEELLLRRQKRHLTRGSWSGRKNVLERTTRSHEILRTGIISRIIISTASALQLRSGFSSNRSNSRRESIVDVRRSSSNAILLLRILSIQLVVIV